MGAVAVAMWHFATTQIEVPEAARTLVITSGTTLKGLSNQLRENGFLYEPFRFIALARVSGHAAGIKAGSYELPEKISPLRLLEKLTRGEFSQSDVTFIEGWTLAQIRQVLDQHPDVRHHTKGLDARQFLSRVGAGEAQPEGLFFPDTYFFAKGASDVQILQRAYRTMMSTLSSEWQQREPDLPYRTPYEALIMASIVEKETGRPEDRSLIAAVFVNRLRKGMLLQTDPTVIYGLGERFDGNLRRVHLETDGPYNTYRRAGLPPTPIAAPGRHAIRASLHPAKSEALYFVARGDGTSHFSSTLDEHNRAVQRYQLRR